MSKINSVKNLRHVGKRINFVLKSKCAETCFKFCLKILLCCSCCEKNIRKSWQNDKKDNNNLLSDLKFIYKI